MLVQRTAHADPRLVENVSVNHSRGHVLVTQQLLHCSDVITVFEEVRRKGMPKRVTTRWLIDSGLANRRAPWFFGENGGVA